MIFLFFLSNVFFSFSMLVYGDRRVFGGSMATLGQFPYQVSVQVKDKPVCTGTIIDESWVITAAICVMEGKNLVSATDISIRAGYVNNAAGSGQLKKATELNVHTVDRNSLALVKVETPYNFNEQVGKLDLSDEPWPRSEGRMCNIAGYGSNENKTTDQLNYLQVKAFRGKQTCPCIENRQLEELICLAPRKGQGACFGDAGGGLVCEGKVEGIITLIIDKETCQYFKPDKYTDCRSKRVYSTCLYICPELDWIKKFVPSVPSTPQTCDKCITETPSVIVLTLCLCILAMGLI